MRLQEAMGSCKARGFISRDSEPNIAYWKRTPGFEKLLFDPNLLWGDRYATDWNTHDPEADEQPLTA